jgi:protein KTI12
VWYDLEFGSMEKVEWLTGNAQVHVGTPIDQCVANNDARLKRQAQNSDPALPKDTSSAPGEAPSLDDEEPYPSELLNNLIFRYEEPSTHSRWDKPLFTVPWEDKEPPVAEIFQALTGVVLPSAEIPTEPPVSGLTESLASSTISEAASTTTTGRAFGRGQSLRPKIIPHQATVQAVATDSGALYAMEKRTSAIVTAVRTFTQSNPSAEAALAQSTNPKGIAINVPNASIPILVPSHLAATGTTDELAGAGGILALPKLQRLRRQWITLNRQYIGHGHGAGTGGLADDQIPDAFVRFLNSTISGEHAE